MTDLNEDIDHYFKDNTDKMDVKFNDAHWDKLQQSLLLVHAVTNEPASSSVAKKGIQLKKIILITALSVITLSTGLYYILHKPATMPKSNQIPIDSVNNTIVEPLIIPVDSNTGTMILPEVKQPIHSNKIESVIKPLQSLPDTHKVHSLPSTKITTPTKDTGTTEKKKGVNLFW